MGPAQPVSVCPSESPQHFFSVPALPSNIDCIYRYGGMPGLFRFFTSSQKNATGPIVAHVLLSVTLTGGALRTISEPPRLVSAVPRGKISDDPQ
jgi:hypothetical protein